MGIAEVQEGKLNHASPFQAFACISANSSLGQVSHRVSRKSRWEFTLPLVGGTVVSHSKSHGYRE